MSYVVFAFVIVCTTLLVVIWLQNRRLRRFRKTERRLEETVSGLGELFREAQRQDDFSLRYKNTPIVSCWESRSCVETACPAYGIGPIRCWQVSGAGLACGSVSCSACGVYVGARAETLRELVEDFNDMMAVIERSRDAANEAKRHVQQAHKLASVGEFAAGVAHEINNPLDGILSCVARLERDPANLTQNIEYLQLIHDALKRISGTVQHLLEYSQKRDMAFEPTDIHEVVDRVIALISTAARRNSVGVAFQFANDVPLVLGDKYYLEQALLNLALNAMSATGTGGEIIFCTRRGPVGGGGASLVEVCVVDTGSGIAPADLDRIFDPFYTTKESGKGTGLGLAIVKGIVEDHGGTIAVESALGSGTTVCVGLPIAERENLLDGTGKEASLG